MDNMNLVKTKNVANIISSEYVNLTVCKLHYYLLKDDTWIISLIPIPIYAHLLVYGSIFPLCMIIIKTMKEWEIIRKIGFHVNR
jgi:hypothetical protein